MKCKIHMGTRIVLGLIYTVFGLNGFLQFLPMPPMPEGAGAFLGALVGTGYFFPVLKATEVLCGLLLLAGFAAPLALVILAPITIQIFLFHSMLTPGMQNLMLPIVMVALHAYTAKGYWSLYKPMFNHKG